MKQVEEKEEACVYQQAVLKNASPCHYLKVHLVLEDESTRLSAVELKHFIITGLKSLYGEVGAALNFDVLKYDEDTLTALLRVYSRGLVRLWSSLTLLGSYQNKACAFRVLQVLVLAANLMKVILSCAGPRMLLQSSTLVVSALGDDSAVQRDRPQCKVNEGVMMGIVTDAGAQLAHVRASGHSSADRMFKISDQQVSPFLLALTGNSRDLQLD